MGNAKNSKTAIISPYLNTLGGGERYILTIAEILSKNSNVVIFWNDASLVTECKNKLGIDLSETTFINRQNNSLSLIRTLSSFDNLFYMTDGSLFIAPSHNNFLIIQSPLHIPKKTLVNKVKLNSFKQVICYSRFVRDIIKNKTGLEAKIIAPPILTNRFKPNKKENMIISVGRFFPWLHSKKQDVLVDSFRQLYKISSFKKWKLVLIGSVDTGAQDYYKEVVKKTHGLPVEIITNAPFSKLIDYFGRSKIYWHATGYGEDLNRYPERAEHFGITTIEAMAAGCIPIVFKAGGQKEIVAHGVNGFLWKTTADLLEKTIEVASNNSKQKSLIENAIRSSQMYSKDVFVSKIKSLLES